MQLSADSPCSHNMNSLRGIFKSPELDPELKCPDHATCTMAKEMKLAKYIYVDPNIIIIL